jgi:hypothetical protein
MAFSKLGWVLKVLIVQARKPNDVFHGTEQICWSKVGWVTRANVEGEEFRFVSMVCLPLQFLWDSKVSLA